MSTLLTNILRPYDKDFLTSTETLLTGNTDAPTDTSQGHVQSIFRNQSTNNNVGAGIKFELGSATDGSGTGVIHQATKTATTIADKVKLRYGSDVKTAISHTSDGSAVVETRIYGNLTVDGTTTTINTATVTIDDPNIELNSVASPTDANADGGGITIKGTTDKIIAWTNSTDAWHYNQGINITSGKLGVGTIAPTTKLHVAGEITLDSENAIRWENGNNQIYGSGDSGTSYLDMQTSGASRIRIKSDGNVGIGLTNPAALLHVATDAIIGDDLSLLSDGAIVNFGADNDVNLTHTADTGLHLNAAMRLAFRDQGGEYIYSVADGELGVVAATKLSITAPTTTASGNVGVGTTSPTSAAGIARFLEVSDASSAGLVLNDTGGRAWNIYSGGGKLYHWNATDGHVLTFWGTDVGVGTATPAKRFHVVGDTQIDDDLFLKSDSAVLNFGADDDVSLTHSADAGLILNSGMKLFFRDAGGEFLRSSVDGTLVAAAGALLSLSAPATAISGNATVAGNLVVDTSTLFVDSATNRVGIGTASPAAVTHLTTAALSQNANPLEVLRVEVTDEGVDMNAGHGPGVDFYVGETGGSNYGGTVAVIKEAEGDADDSAAMVFHTASDNQVAGSDREKMRITSAGKVGIGTTSPASVLDVEGNVAIGAAYSGTTAAPTNGLTVEGFCGVGTPTPTETLHVRDGRTSGGSSGLLIQKFEDVSGTSYGAFIEATGASTKNIGLYVQAEGGTTNYGLVVPNGSVGIGTANPGTLLQLESTVPYVTLKNSTSENIEGGCESKIIFEDHADVTLAQIQGSHDGGAADTKGDLIFSTHDGSSLTEGLRIDSANLVTVAGALTVGGNLTVNGTTTTIASTVTTHVDPLIELNTGAGSNSNDLGFVFERGSTGNNACLIWDESADGFAVGTTTATGASTGNMTFAAAPFESAALTATTGGFSGVVTATGFTIGSAAILEAELEILDGALVTTTELNLLDGDTAVGSTITVIDADGFVVNDGGTMKTIPASAVKTYAGSGTITALNNQAVSRLVTIGSTTTELDGEANFTFTGSAATLLGSLTVGVSDTGHNVKFYGATAGTFMLWDQASDDLTLAGVAGLVQSGTGANSFAGATQFSNTVTVGVDDTGYDVKFFGDAASAYMLWNASDDALELTKDTDAEFVALKLVNQSDAASAAGQVSIQFDLEDTGGTAVDAGKIKVSKEASFTATASTQDATMSFYLTENGSMTQKAYLQSTGAFSAATLGHTSAQTGYITLHPSDFVVTDYSVWAHTFETAVADSPNLKGTTGGTTSVETYAPVHLPPGCSIVNFDLYLELSGVSNVSAVLYRTDAMASTAALRDVSSTNETGAAKSTAILTADRGVNVATTVDTDITALAAESWKIYANTDSSASAPILGADPYLYYLRVKSTGTSGAQYHRIYGAKIKIQYSTVNLGG